MLTPKCGENLDSEPFSSWTAKITQQIKTVSKPVFLVAPFLDPFVQPHCLRDSPHGPNFCQMWQKCAKFAPRSLKCHQHRLNITPNWTYFVQNLCQKRSRNGNAKSNAHLRPLANHLKKSGGTWTPEGMFWAMVLTLQVGGPSSKLKSMYSHMQK